MLSRKDRIDEFQLKLTRTEKELYEEFLKAEETALVQEMQRYFVQAKEHAGGIRFDDASFWSRIEKRVDVWFVEVCADRNQHSAIRQRKSDPACLGTML
jgi:hypothetical protein